MIKILVDPMADGAVLYYSLTEKVFGEVIRGDGNRTAQEIAEDFLAFLSFNHVAYPEDDFRGWMRTYLDEFNRGEWPPTNIEV